jgi:hypothetical protein
MRTPAVVSVEMGYGHLRAARPLAQLLGEPILHADRPPLAEGEERERWSRARTWYERVSRASQIPLVGAPFRSLLDGVTQIPHLYPYRDLSAPNLAVRAMERMFISGFGEGLAKWLRRSGRPMVTTFYAPALIADYHGCDDVWCVVTDTDCARVWAPIEPRKSRIRYFAPSMRALRRLRVYGVPDERIVFSGFPLPHALLGGPSLGTLKRNLAARLVRLDRRGSFREGYGQEIDDALGPLPTSEERVPPLVTFAVGGAGAQKDMVELFLPRMRRALFAGRLRLALVAGVRPEVAAYFRRQIDAAGLGRLGPEAVRVVHALDLDGYFDAFDAVMAETDVLYTKPSELTFYAALGIPIVSAWPVGHHERLNRRFLLESGAGLKQYDPRHADEWIEEWLDDGTLAAAAWSGFMRLPKTGTYRILETFGYQFDARGVVVADRGAPGEGTAPSAGSPAGGRAETAA